MAYLITLAIWIINAKLLYSIHPGFFDKTKNISVTVAEVGPYSNPIETYQFYMLPYCQPEKIIEEWQTLGEDLSGDRTMNSLYTFRFAENVSYATVCFKKLSKYDKQDFRNAIDQNYMGAYSIEGFHVSDIVGKEVNGRYFLKTHIDFNIVYFNGMIIYANISEPKFSDFQEIDSSERDLVIDFTYSVLFFDFPMYRPQIDEKTVREETEEQDIMWFGIINSFFLVIVLSCFVLIVLSRTVRNQIRLIHNFDLEQNSTDHIRWKLIRNEILMAPRNRSILSSFIGYGVQFLIMIFGIIIFGVVGMYYEHKGTAKTVGIILFSFTGVFNGYYSARYYKFMGGRHWARTLILSALFFPLVVFVVTLFNNIFAVAWGSTAAIPITSWIFIILITILIYLPLTLFGGLTGRMKSVETLPFNEKYIKIPKELPRVRFYNSFFAHFCMAGLMPFTSIYLELHFIFTSVWGHRTFHFYGTLFLTWVLLIFVVVCVTITFVYFIVNSEDYRWWWKSFLLGGSSSFFMFLYCIYYATERTTMFGFLQLSYYFTYSILFCFVNFMVLGTVGFLSAKKFIMYIYNQSKID